MSRISSADVATSENTSRTRSGKPSSSWRTAVTLVEQNRILIRGYPVDEMMGRASFAETIYLLLTGELPTPAIGRLMDALLVSSIDHGPTPPSTTAARHVATSGAPLRASVAAGVLAFGDYHGGDIEACMQFLADGLGLVRQGQTYEAAAAALLSRCGEANQRRVPGFGSRWHTRDPRTARLFQMALELELDGPHMQMVRAVERTLATEAEPGTPPAPLNVDGAIAAVCSDLGLDISVGNALFIISRVPGIIAQAREEMQRERPMRQIDTLACEYDGPPPRRLPETRR